MTPPDPQQVAKIAGRLSKAQRDWLAKYSKWRAPALGHPQRWMTFPPSNTAGVLQRLGLIDGVGQLRDLGLAVRTHLKGTHHD